MNKEATIVSVVMIRHAQSQWNKENRFTGWANPPLTETGIQEAIEAAACLRTQGYLFDLIYTSRLQRAIKTAKIIMANSKPGPAECIQDWRLNERHYGTLQGTDKNEATRTVGEEQVWRWRRGYTERAMALPVTAASHPINDIRYTDVDSTLLPSVENLADTRRRVTEFWQQIIVPQIQHSRRLLISAHGNTLRALIMELANMTVEQVEGFEIPTATPIIYNFKPTGESLNWHYLSPCDSLKSA